MITILSRLLTESLRSTLESEIPDEHKAYLVFMERDVRGCLAKWHRIDAGRPLSSEERAVVAAIARWLDRNHVDSLRS